MLPQMDCQILRTVSHYRRKPNMLKYRGVYRVVFETDTHGKPMEFTYIPCRVKKGASVCRHDAGTLNVLIPGHSTADRLLKEYPDLFEEWQMGTGEATLTFPEARLSEAARVLKPFTLGKAISPRSKRNRRFTCGNTG